MGSFATILGFLSGLGGWEILLILMVLLIFFGAKKIPELARGLGKGAARCWAALRAATATT